MLLFEFYLNSNMGSMKCKFCEYENDNKETICQYCGSYLKFPTSYIHIIIGIILIVFGKFLSDTYTLVIVLFSFSLSIYGVIISSKEASKVRKIRKEHNIDIKQLVNVYMQRIEKENASKIANNPSNNKEKKIINYKYKNIFMDKFLNISHNPY